jgi:hypothetical protein
MATLYFNGSSWGDTTAWYLTFNNTTGQLSNHANRIPNATDTAILCSNLTDLPIAGFVEPAVLQLGIIYNNGANYYSSFWNGDDFYFYDRDFNFPVVNLTAYSEFWASTIKSYYFGTINFYVGSKISSVASVGTANFYDYSTNGGDQADGRLYGNVNFYNYSKNGNFNYRGSVFGTANFYNYSANACGGNVEGEIHGNAIFHDYSSNADSVEEGAQSGIIYGNTIFNDYSTNCIANNSYGNYAGGAVFGNATFNNNASNGQVDTTGGGYTDSYGHVYGGQIIYTSTSSFANTLQAGANAQSITMPATGIPQSKVYLNELLKLPFPVVIQ